jgi:hypothetical protein
MKAKTQPRPTEDMISPAYDQGKTKEEIRDRWLRYWEALYYHRGDRTTASDGG